MVSFTQPQFIPEEPLTIQGNETTYGLLYNLFGDKELGLGIVPQSVYDIQSAFYPTVFGKYGVPLDTRHSYTKSKLADTFHVETRC
jgi:Domain of unknown function (DUF1793)